jgi:release factor glutamine methyltransferase
VTGSDVDPAALAVAAANGAALGLDVAWQPADLLAGLPDAYDAIVANPPYVERAALATLEPEISRHEPRHALDGGPSGLDTITRLIDQAASTSASILILEHGQGQEEAIAAHCRAAGYGDLEHHRDLAQIARVLRARR